MKGALYARVSTKDKGQSTENQLPELRRYAEAHGYTVYKEYVEKESAGTGNRSEFKALFADAHPHRFALVLFWSLDRFGREGALPTLQYLNQLEAWGVGYKSLTEQYLDSTGLFKDAIAKPGGDLGLARPGLRTRLRDTLPQIKRVRLHTPGTQTAL
jgi:DNA invertase Pin-like site-specific DNA recombinase